MNLEVITRKILAQRIETALGEWSMIETLLKTEGPRLVKLVCGSKGAPFTLRGAAKHYGLSPTYLSRVLNRQCVISPAAFLKLARGVP